MVASLGCEVREVGVDDILGAPAFPALIEEYAAESKIDGMPHPRIKLETYRQYESSGMLHCFAADVDLDLVGFITVIAPVLPHYSVPVAVVESFFLAARYRASFLGLRLLATAEKRAAEVGSPGLLVCAPFGGKLFELLPKCGYVETNRVFFKPSCTKHEPEGDSGGSWP